MTVTAPQSPCISVCRIGADGCCAGCYRTLEEIAGWLRKPAEVQWAIVRAADARRRAAGERAARPG
jgi:hypothetical protein